MDNIILPLKLLALVDYLNISKPLFVCLHLKLNTVLFIRGSKVHVWGSVCFLAIIN